MPIYSPLPPEDQFWTIILVQENHQFPVPENPFRIDLPVAEIINHPKSSKIKDVCRLGDFETFFCTCPLWWTKHFKKKVDFWIWVNKGIWTSKTEISVKMGDSCISISKSQITLFWLLEGICAQKWRSQKSGLFFSLNVPTRSPKNGHFESKSMMKIFKISDFHVFSHFSSENRLFRLWKLIQIRQNHKGKSFISGFEKITRRSIGEKRPNFVFTSDFFFKKWSFSFFSFLESGIRFSGTRESVQNWSPGGRDY